MACLLRSSLLTLLHFALLWMTRMRLKAHSTPLLDSCVRQRQWLLLMTFINGLNTWCPGGNRSFLVKIKPRIRWQFFFFFFKNFKHFGVRGINNLAPAVKKLCSKWKISCKSWKLKYLLACVLSRFSHDRLFMTLWTVALQAPLSMGFTRQEYWSGLPCLPPEDLPNPVIKPLSPISPALAGRFFTSSTTWECQLTH